MRVAVILPCHNEEAAIADVIASFRKALPEASVFVCDNASTDRTAEVARGAGAVVIREPLKGKGNAVRRLFADVEADVYVMADGDGTYECAKAQHMVDLLVSDGLDMVVGIRVEEPCEGSDYETYRKGHRLGNRIFNDISGRLFNRRFQDIFSGYRVFSRRFVKSFPVLSSGFEIETELTVHAAELSMSVHEVETAYGRRPAGSLSKLNTYRDGARIMAMMVKFFKDHSPFQFYLMIAYILGLISFMLAYPLLETYINTGLVPRIPTAVLSAAIGVLSCLCVACGAILDSVCRSRRQMSRLAYLSAGPGPHEARDSAGNGS